MRTPMITLQCHILRTEKINNGNHTGTVSKTASLRVTSGLQRWFEERQATNQLCWATEAHWSTRATKAIPFDPVTGYGRNVAQHTAHHTLTIMGLCCCRPIRVPMTNVTVKSTNNWHVSVRTGPWGSARWLPGIVNFYYYFFFYISRQLSTCVIFTWWMECDAKVQLEWSI